MNERKAVTSQVLRPVEDLAQRACAHMQNLEYEDDTIRGHRGVWRRLAAFAGGEEFSQELVKRFLASIVDSTGRIPNSETVRGALNWLRLYQAQGFVRFNQKRVVVTLSEVYERTLRKYEINFRKLYAGSEESIQKRLAIARRFLGFVGSQGCSCVAELHSCHVRSFVQSLSSLKPRTISQLAIDLKPFLRYAWLSGHVAEDLSASLPRIWTSTDTHIPIVFTADEIANILSAVDRSSPKGKRDFAMLLLACRLGLRAGDIRKLRLENLNWKESQIELTQSKTGMPLALPITTEVGDALIDYLQHGRPVTDCREVFVTVCAPFTPFTKSTTLSGLVELYRHRAKVLLPRGGRSGMHSLRHSIATRLLEGGVPLKTISDILGHKSMESTRIYTKVNLPALRRVPLDPDNLATKGGTPCPRQ